jgi:hypothetical protein
VRDDALLAWLAAAGINRQGEPVGADAGASDAVQHSADETFCAPLDAGVGVFASSGVE